MGIKDLQNRSQSAMAKPDAAEVVQPSRVARTITAPGAAAALRPAMLELQTRAETAEAEIKRLQQSAGAPFKIDMGQLVSVPGRRRKLTEEQFSDLVENLRVNPMVHPIVVMPLKDGRYEIISGENRVAAYRSLGRTEIECTYFTVEAGDEADTKTYTSAFYANLLQPSLPDVEKFLGFKEIMTRTGLSRSEVANAAGISMANLSNLMVFDQLPRAVLDQLAQAPSVMGFSAARKLVSLLESEGAEDALLERLPDLIARRITQEELLRNVAAKVRSVRAPKSAVTSMKFKKGRSAFCDFKSAGTDLRISFKDEEARAAIEEEIVAVLKKYASIA